MANIRTCDDLGVPNEVVVVHRDCMAHIYDGWLHGERGRRESLLVLLLLAFSPTIFANKDLSLWGLSLGYSSFLKQIGPGGWMPTRLAYMVTGQAPCSSGRPLIRKVVRHCHTYETHALCYQPNWQYPLVGPGPPRILV
jgi:hypothetical protein